MTRPEPGSPTELAQRIERLTGADGTFTTAYPDLSFVRSSTVSEPIHTVYKPSLCVVAQGAKRVLLGSESYQYDPSSFLAASVHLPITGQVTEAVESAPYLSLQLQFDMEQILDVMSSAKPAAQEELGPRRGLVISRLSNPLHEAVLRLVRLLDTPEDLQAIGPYVVREILYRMLQSDQGHAIRQFALMGNQTGRIAHVIERMNHNYKEPIRVDELAEEAMMSPSSFYAYFKEVTNMTPIQYQKQLRLQEARRLLLATPVDATSAAYQVGYESATQFSREYARLFGQPPMRDVRRFRESLHQ
ncbi:AraC family transcriptional regulator N-terminal domain-containing protein [Paenibacillus sp. 1P07SE]|uniref:AraC family transcriptional regulator n=1 Tax=Paenibacillus sp. 1P07SE TaxID=3132209 RepID=UPI0039A61FA1